MTEDNQVQSAIAGWNSTWRRFLSFFVHVPEPTVSHQLYDRLVKHARLPFYYGELGVPDTPEGRFEILALHVGLTIRRLMQEEGAGRATAQSLMDLMIADMDVNLRELGVGDLSVGKQVKRLAGQLNARIDVLQKAFDSGDHGGLQPMLATNAYHGVETPSSAHLATLIGCLKVIEQELARQAVPDLAAGRLHLPDEQALRDVSSGV